MNPWSPVHWSAENGVHSDRFIDDQKFHQPFYGQTTLDVFCNRGSYANDVRLRDLGGNPPSLEYGHLGMLYKP